MCLNRLARVTIQTQQFPLPAGEEMTKETSWTIMQSSLSILKHPFPDLSFGSLLHCRLHRFLTMAFSKEAIYNNYETLESDSSVRFPIGHLSPWTFSIFHNNVIEWKWEVRHVIWKWSCKKGDDRRWVLISFFVKIIYSSRMCDYFFVWAPSL